MRASWWTQHAEAAIHSSIHSTITSRSNSLALLVLKIKKTETKMQTPTNGSLRVLNVEVRPGTQQPRRRKLGLTDCERDDELETWRLRLITSKPFQHSPASSTLSWTHTKPLHHQMVVHARETQQYLAKISEHESAADILPTADINCCLGSCKSWPT